MACCAENTSSAITSASTGSLIFSAARSNPAYPACTAFRMRCLPFWRFFSSDALMAGTSVSATISEASSA